VTQNLYCTSIIEERFLDYNFDATVINNFYIKNDDGPEIHIPGETYLFYTDSAYGHSLVDVYAQFKILQLKYKNIKPFFYRHSNQETSNKITIDQIESLGHKNADIFNISVGNYSFKKVVMFFDMNLTFPDEFYLENGATKTLKYFPFCSCYLGILPCGESEYFKYNYLAIDILKESFKHFFNDKKTTNIFVSRERYNNRYKQQIDFYSSKELLSDKEKELYAMAKYRYSDKDSYIQNIFKNNGYTIIYAEDYSLIEQIKIFSSAKNIVGLSGTWLFNSFWGDKETSVFEISAIPGHRYHYKEFADHAGVKHSYINVVGLSQEDTVKMIQENINKIKENEINQKLATNEIIDFNILEQARAEKRIHIFKDVFPDRPSWDTILSVIAKYVEEDLEDFTDKSYLSNGKIEEEYLDMKRKCRFWSRLAFQLYDQTDPYMTIIPELEPVTSWVKENYPIEKYQGNFGLVTFMKNKGVVGSKHSDYVDQFQWVVHGEMIWRTGDNLENETHAVAGDFIFVPKDLVHEVETFKAPRACINVILHP